MKSIFGQPSNEPGHWIIVVVGFFQMTIPFFFHLDNAGLLFTLGVTQLRYLAFGRCAFRLRQHGGNNHFCVRFFRATRGKTAHKEKIEYRSAEGSAGQVRKS